MIQVIYTSSAARDLPSGEVFRIVTRSAANNGRDGLCGFLIFFNQRFFQVLEGPKDAVDALMHKVEADPRHHSITIVERKAIAVPSFGSWRMKRLHAPPGTVSPEQIDPHLANAPSNVLSAMTAFFAGQEGLPTPRELSRQLR